MSHWFSPFLVFALLFAGTAHAESEERVAVVVSQAVGVGALADHLGNLVADRLEAGSVPVVRPGDAARMLRERGAADPSSCGSDPTCLEEIAEALRTRWVVALGIGSFGEVFSLELRAVDQESEEGPSTISSTYAAPGPNWEEALAETLTKLVPKRLLHKRGDLLVVSRHAGAEIRINGLAAGTVPLAQPLRLPAGSYEVELNLAGYSTARETVAIEAGGAQELRLALVPVGGPPPPLRTYAWIASGTSVAALATAIGLHVSAAGAMDDARDLQRAGRPFLSEREGAQGRMTAARITYGLAGATAVGAALLFLLDPANIPTANATE